MLNRERFGSGFAFQSDVGVKVTTRSGSNGAHSTGDPASQALLVGGPDNQPSATLLFIASDRGVSYQGCVQTPQPNETVTAPLVDPWPERPEVLLTDAVAFGDHAHNDSLLDWTPIESVPARCVAICAGEDQTPSVHLVGGIKGTPNGTFPVWPSPNTKCVARCLGSVAALERVSFGAGRFRVEDLQSQIVASGRSHTFVAPADPGCKCIFMVLAISMANFRTAYAHQEWQSLVPS